MKETKIALGTWSWGSGAVGGDQVLVTIWKRTT